MTKEIPPGRKWRVVKVDLKILHFIYISTTKSFQSVELSPRWTEKNSCTFLIDGSTVRTILRPNIWGWIIFTCFSLHWENNQHGLSGSWSRCSTSRTCRWASESVFSSSASCWMGEPRLWVSPAQSQESLIQYYFLPYPTRSKMSSLSPWVPMPKNSEVVVKTASLKMFIFRNHWSFLPSSKMKM